MTTAQIAHYRSHVSTVLDDLARDGLTAEHEVPMYLRAALFALERMGKEAVKDSKIYMDSDGYCIHGSPHTCSYGCHADKEKEAKKARPHGSGPLPGNNVTVVQTGEKTLFVRGIEEKPEERQ